MSAEHPGPLREGARPPRPREFEPAEVQRVDRRLTAEQNLPVALLGGSGAALLGAGLWTAVAVAAVSPIPIMAIGVGVGVGSAIRSLGRGIDIVFGVAGALITFFGCALGNLLALTSFVAGAEGLPYGVALSRLDPELALRLTLFFFGLPELLFFSVAIYAGYRLSFRRLTRDELRRLLAEPAGIVR